jgi:PAS domain S-box-containing protein
MEKSSTLEEQLRLFVEQAPVGIAMFDLGMICVAASRRWLADFGRGHEPIIGRCHYDIHPDLPERWREIHRRGLAGETQQCDDDLWIQSDGSKHWLRWVVQPWLDLSGRIGGIIIFAEDITARKRDEALLHAQKEQLALITNNLPGPLALLGSDGRYVFVNQRFGAWIGKPPSEILGRTPREIVTPEAFERARPQIERLMRGESIVYENYIRTPDGELHHGLITAVPQRAADGTLSSFIVVGSDITEVKRAEQALRQANETLEQRVRERTAELQAANQELEAFSYSVSHDLRAPLRVIDGFSRIALESFAAELPAEAQGLLRDIRSNTQQMGRLIDDLLAFSRLSRQPLRRQSVVTNDLVASILHALRAEMEGRSVELRIEALSACAADPGLLKQVFWNLLDNALKYSKRRDPAVIEVGSQPGSQCITYYVRDNGIGFDMRHAHKLFGVFQRLHGAEDYQGTGVGLAIVQRIVERHGGRIWAEAEPDRGATFYFTIPVS